MEIYSRFILGDISAHYLREGERGPVGLRILPADTEASIAEHRKDLSGLPEAKPFLNWGGYPKAAAVEPLVQLCIRGDVRAGGFTPGQTMRNAMTSLKLALADQRPEETDAGVQVVTTLCTERGITARHLLIWKKSRKALACYTEIENKSGEKITLEMVSSFTMGFITPFEESDAPGRLKIHRFRSSWSSEGRHVCETAEELELERSWANHELKCERFGQVGSNPVRRWFPFAAVEDSTAGVMWGVQPEASGSWQLELYRKDDFLHLSGGPADYEFGHWFKHLEPGGRFLTPVAYITAVRGGLDEICARLIEVQETDDRPAPESENDLPVVFNEWCASWGKPSHDNLLRTAKTIAGLDIRYLVIDAGWYANPEGNWGSTQGDWEVSSELFPGGLKKTCDEIRALGLIPGLWFEFEVAGECSRIWNKTDWFLSLDCRTIQAGTRRFFDFRKAEVRTYLLTKITDLLLECGIGYFKIDYNEPLGIGCDGAESPGEGLRQHLEEVKNFLSRLREKVPGLVIENCSSGGHRQEPSFIKITDMSSFSDSHETKEIPIIAANLNRLVLPKKLQVWAVLHPADDERRLVYSLAACFLGRMCLSGEISELSERRLSIVKKAVDFHREVRDLIACIPGVRHGSRITSHRYPEGWQALVKTSANGCRALIVFHAFSRPPSKIDIPLPPAGRWKIASHFSESGSRPDLAGRTLRFSDTGDFYGAIVLLEKE